MPLHEVQASTREQRPMRDLKSQEDKRIEMDERELTWLTQEAWDQLDKHKLLEAGDSFVKILNHTATPDSWRHPEQAKRVAGCLRGLALVYMKRGKAMRHQELDWYHMYLQSAAVLKRSVDYCRTVLEETTDNKLTAWLQENEHKASSRLNMVEDSVVQALKNNLLPEEQKKGARKKGTCKDLIRQEQTINFDWLIKMENYCIEKLSADLAEKEESYYEEPSEIPEMETEEMKEKRKRDNRAHFCKVQKAIVKLVKEISQDVRKKYIRQKLPEHMLRRSVSCEMLNLVGTDPDEDTFLSTVFEKYVNENDEVGDDGISMGGSNVGENTGRTKELSVDVAGAEDSATGITHAITEDISVPIPLTPIEANWFIDPDRLLDEQRIPDFKKINLSGVLTIWRHYPKHDGQGKTIKTLPYVLHNFEEVSPLTAIPSMVLKSQQVFEEKTEEDENVSGQRFMPVEQSNLRLALGKAVVKLADRLKLKRQRKSALNLYKYALGVMQGARATASHMADIAYIVQRVGLLKCSMGDFIGGHCLMEEAIKIYETLPGPESAIRVAEAWQQLGVAFLTEQTKQGTIFRYMLRLVREYIKGEYKQEEPDISDDESDSESESEGGTYGVNTNEALTCFNNSMHILRKLRQHEDVHTGLYVDVLIGVADCCTMLGNYSRAVMCYEEAFFLFETATTTTDALKKNAHVLTMLGSMDFLLGQYQKAVATFETAQILQQPLCVNKPSFEMAFTLTMLGLSYYLRNKYHKSIAWCLKAWEMYSELYKHIHVIDCLNRWFIVENLYILGYSYNTVNFTERSLNFLIIAKEILIKSDDKDIKQLVKILKVIGDVHTAMEDHECALKSYNDALEYCVTLGDENMSNTLQNQLLNRMAGVHVSTKQYGTAAKCLEQALTYQQDVANDIKGDLIGILHQLGLTYTRAGDLDKAIDCYTECIDAYNEMPGSPCPEMAQTLGNIATLYHVKACIQDDNDAMTELLQTAETHYKQAQVLDPYGGVCLNYGNFLYQQQRYADALIAILIFVIDAKRVQDIGEVYYKGLEQAILPEHFVQEVDSLDDASLDVKIFAKFLAILCYKNLRMIEDADSCLLSLVHSVGNSTVPINHSILGYALFEMNLYEEAADSFMTAASYQTDQSLAVTNAWLCLFTGAYVQISRCLHTIYHFYNKSKRILTSPSVKRLSPFGLVARGTASEHQQNIRDSGYFDHGGSEAGSEEVAWLSTVRDHTMTEYRHTTASKPETRAEIDKGYTSYEYLDKDWSSSEALSTKDSPVSEQWHTYIETIETPHIVMKSTSDSNRVETLRTNQEKDDTENSSHNNNSRFYDEDTDDDVDESIWITEEETVDTPEEVIRFLQLKGGMPEMTTTSSGETQHQNMSIDTPVSEELSEKRSIKAEVRSPAIETRKSSRLSHGYESKDAELKHKRRSSGGGVSQLRSMFEQKSHDTSEQSRHTVANTINNNVGTYRKAIDNNKNHLGEQSVDATSQRPATLPSSSRTRGLRYVDSNNTKSIQLQPNASSAIDDDSSSYWSSEETVETPEVLLRAIMASQKGAV